MLIKPALVLIVFAVVAQLLPSCGGGQGVVGWVEEKVRRQSSETIEYIIVINHIEYSVPPSFWQIVEVGDLVKQEASGQWVIVRKRGS